MGASFSSVGDSSDRHCLIGVRQNALQNESLLAHNVCSNTAAPTRRIINERELAARRGGVE